MLYLQNMKDVVLVFFGGGLGSVCRYLLARWVNTFHAHHFPFGTFAVNVVACFALGAILGFIAQKEAFSPATKMFLAVGFCGGFSTFSTFSHESVVLFQQGHYISLTAYILLSVVLCIAATLSGLFLAEKLI